MDAVADTIRRKLTDAFAPDALEIVDDSDKHAGHAGHRESGESHFTVRITSAKFAGQGRVQRQRAVYTALEEELRPDGVHALSIEAHAPGEGAA